MSNWFVTGGCGFLGTTLVDFLRRQPGSHSIRLFDNLSVGQPSDVERVAACEVVTAPVDWSTPGGAVQIVVGDITDADALAKASVGADVIVHFAANTGVAPSVEDPMGDCVANVIGTLNALEAARHNNIKRFVFASSGAPAGEVEPPIHENVVPKPVSPYGASKLAGEAYCSAYFRTFKIDTVALRFGNVYGPLSQHKSSVVAKFTRRAIEGLPLEIYGNGMQTRDFIYSEDLAEAVWKAARVPGVGGEVFQIATNRETNLRELTDALMLALDACGIARPEVIFSEPRLGDVMRNYSDTSKAAKMLGWVPHISLDEGLGATVSALKATRIR